jgi:predicted lipid-binding transport protein (Tim44 family)
MPRLRERRLKHGPSVPMLWFRFVEVHVLSIIIFAMVALFLGMRLYAVLGKRTGHEQQPLARAPEDVVRPVPAIVSDRADSPPATPDEVVTPGAEAGLRAIAAADRSFDAEQFLDGAKYAYQMILEGFWAGKEDAYRDYVSPDVRDSFGEAITARTEQGHVLDNRMIRIVRAVISDAKLSGGIADVTVKFESDIASVTRDAEGKVIAGSLSDAVESRDSWTFSRTLRSDDPNWILTDTDDDA